MEKMNEQAKTGFTPEQIKAIRAELLRLKPANPIRADGRVTIKDTIRQLAPTLAKMKAKGFTNTELAEHLGKKGLIIKASTLGKYINSGQKPGLRAPHEANTEIQGPEVESTQLSSCL